MANKLKKIILSIILLVGFTSCDNPSEKSDDFFEIKLNGALAERSIEASGLAWYKDNLIVLPQFPHKWSDKYDGALFSISKKRLDDYISGKNRKPIEGKKIDFIAVGLDDIGKRKGSGYEALTFIGDTVFVSIESVNGEEGTDYVVKGVIDFPNKKIILNEKSKTEVKSQTGIFNMGEETILSFRNKIYTIHEANGLNVNDAPYLTELSTTLETSKKIPFQNIEYRITDATSVDSSGKFFVTNYFYPGEYGKLKPDLDSEARQFAIEQILELKINDNDVKRTKKRPIIISYGKNKKGNNWEGIVKYKTGFLIITDMFPKTLLVYKEANEN